MPNNDNNGIGRLKIGAVGQDTISPLADAIVKIFDSENQSKQIEQSNVNISGQTQDIWLPCPNKSLSQEPNPPKRPYAEYTVSINANGYKEKIIQGVQVLSDNGSYQEASLEPLESTNNTSTPQIQDINIPDHTLWGSYPPKTPEDPIKPLPKSGGFVVLPKPVIPEFVIVHNGIPTQKAENYKVSFKQYIKNCACCEIYPSWSDQTIRANILAIMSFTLNRVYTEWYRGKGFDFTITNSTAYDQSYTHGRNIFDNISQITDELFTTYITRPGIDQPYFTQYCDGKTVACPKWMSQWGSKTLGDSGLMALEILRRYYGSDIFLTHAESVAGVPESYPGKVLKMGSTGANVKVIQQQLNAISNNYPAIPKQAEDGVFGQNTLDAVKTFQTIFQLSSDGIVGLATWYKISSIFVAVKKLAAGQE